MPITYSERLKAAAAYTRDCERQYREAVKARNRVIVEAIDGGHPQHQAARDTGLKQPHIVRILSTSETEG